MSDKDKAIELLREIATHQSSGLRGIVRMQRLQLEAIELLAKIDKRKTKA